MMAVGHDALFFVFEAPIVKEEKLPNWGSIVKNKMYHEVVTCKPRPMLLCWRHMYTRCASVMLAVSGRGLLHCSVTMSERSLYQRPNVHFIKGAFPQVCGTVLNKCMCRWKRTSKQQQIVRKQLRKVRAQQQTCVHVLNFQCVHCDAHDYLVRALSLSSASGAKTFARVCAHNGLDK